ncbi:hypothetical protein HKX48_009206 [Thoreauomyces humboldtii]|nr:hypothetical protein HKX48_009206 [Thoreauomyces humboldtii]
MHGILAESDMYRKEAEFRTWMVEVKKMSPETTDNRQMKAMFLEYAEDYNLAVLPPKYYNLDAWEREQEIRTRAEAGVEVVPEFSILNDEAVLKMNDKALRGGKLPELNYSNDQLTELKKLTEDRIKADRLRKLGFQPKSSLGVRYEKD